MKTCGLHLSILLFVGVASLPAFADWNFFGNNDDYSGYQSNASGTVYVRVEGANIRSAPFVNGSSVFSVLPHNTRLRVIRKDSYSDSGTWYFVSDGRGHTGWVNAHLLSSRPAQSSSAARSSRSSHVATARARARAPMHAASATASPSVAPAPTPTASASTAAPAASSSSTATSLAAPQPAVAGWHDPVQKLDSSAFPPPPDFAVNSKAQPASATPSVAKQQPAAATPPPARPTAAAPTKSEPPKRVARKAPSKRCITHYPSQNLPTDASEKQREEWDQDHEILTEVQKAIHGKILRANYANQLSSMYDITLNFPAESKGRFSSAPIFLNFTGGVRGSELKTIRSGVVICVKNGVITADLVDNRSGSSNGHLTINGVDGGFSASGIIKTADYGDVQIDETFTRASR